MPTIQELIAGGGKTPIEYMQESQQRDFTTRSIGAKTKEDELALANNQRDAALATKYEDENRRLTVGKLDASNKHVTAQANELNSRAMKEQYDVTQSKLKGAAQIIGAGAKQGMTHADAIRLVMKGQTAGHFDQSHTDEAIQELMQIPADKVYDWATQTRDAAMTAVEQLKAWHDQDTNKLQAARDAETVKNNAATQTGNAETRAQTAKNQNDMRDISRGQLAVSQGHLAETRRVNSVTEKANAAANTPEALAASMQPKPMTIQQETKYRTQMAKDYSSANAVLDSMDEILDSAESVKTAPGLKGATGIQSYIPSFPNSKAANAQVRLSNLEGKVTQLGKAAASSSGAIGSMAVQEWKIVRDMIANIDRSKGDEPLLEQISLIENQAKGASDRLREGYQAHYGKDFESYPQFANIGTTKERKSRAKQPASNSAPSNKPTVSNW